MEIAFEQEWLRQSVVNKIGADEPLVDEELINWFNLPVDCKDLPMCYVLEGNILEQSLLVVKDGVCVDAISDIDVARFLLPYKNEVYFCSDGALSPYRAGCGVVGIEEGGSMVALAATVCEEIGVIKLIELQAVQEAVNLAKDKYEGTTKHMVFALDSYQAVKSLHDAFHERKIDDDASENWEKVGRRRSPAEKYKLQQEENCDHLSSSIIAECKSVWDRKFTFLVIPREINIVADFLSRVVKDSKSNVRSSKINDFAVQKIPFYDSLRVLLKRTLYGSFVRFGLSYRFVQAKITKMEEMRTATLARVVAKWKI